MGDLSLLELTSQHGFDAMNFGGNVSGRQASDLRYGSCVETFEVRKDHVSVKRFQALDQNQKAVQRVVLINGCSTGGVGQVLQFFEPDQRLRARANLPCDV